ncbi:MAG: hypothetical protein KGI37_07775 [Alphaproteobacteria bacterium]|nr:hypothetical protein [Alphaproteobacteria bacterium]
MIDDLILKVAGQQISGWTEIRVTRGIERLPSDFEIGLTEAYPGTTQATVLPGDACQVLIGGNLVITGYVDRYAPSIAPGQHRVRISGRGKCQDMVDCSAEWPNNQISNATGLSLATALAKPYGITVTDLSGSTVVVPQFNFMWGESAYDVLERACRYLKLLVYDGPDGNLILSQVGTTKAASGFVEGQNVLNASITYSLDQRYSEYVARLMSFAALNDIGSAGDVMGTFPDKGVPRHRQLQIVVENGQTPALGGETLAVARGKWEAARRFGRSAMLRLTVDSWRDKAGTLWTPNTLVDITLPSLKTTKKTWVIGEVTCRLDESGTTADLVLMPPQAFEPEPVLLQPWFADLITNAGGQQ